MGTDWKRYEDVARTLLNHILKDLKLSSVEGKQHLVGHETGTEWEVDAKGVSEDGESFVLVETRQYRASRQSQEKVAALAYRIHDTGASGGVIVSPLGLQAGAKKVADANNIVSVEIDADSTPENFSLRFVNLVMTGITEVARASAEAFDSVERSCMRCGRRFDFDFSTAEVVCCECRTSAPAIPKT